MSAENLKAPEKPVPSLAATVSNYKWTVVFMLWFVCFLNYADRQAISSVLPLLSKEFGFDSVQLGLIGSAFAWVYAAAAPVAGAAADRFPRKWLLVWACVIWSFFTLATMWCNHLSWFVTVRALTGLGETFYFPAAMALISDYHSRQTRSRALAWHQSAVYAGTILGSWLAAVLAERYGWRNPFFFFGPCGFLMALVLVRFLREPRRGSADGPTLGAHGEARAADRPLPVRETISIILRTPPALLLMGAFLCANFVAVIFLTWTPTFLVQKFHYSIGAAGLTGTVYIHLASALAVPFAGWFADRLAQRWAAGRMMVQGAGLLIGASFVFLVGHVSTASMLLVAMTCFGLCKGFYDSGIFASLYDVIEPRARGTAAGLINTIGWGAGALGPLFVGFASKYGGKPTAVENMSDAIGFGALFYLAGTACVVGAILMVNRRARSAAPSQ